ncbi:ATP-binding cassette domain-containing protein [Paenibacillus sp. S150]|uniref:ATP-binding cassette domain-containing protein n=1 Tax=Paenibacillus sp. S150 TaxID=2749826 RepID=UPI001C575C34|nr:ATP-binding cassette domain-containing protein [Paenibacillus sp. S150]MBW4081242.1 ATP-binding cassette domain-containing protein [Paenibacillus sp. S150]
MTYKVEILEATKQFKETAALNQVTAKFAAGRIHGIIGRNGSGKTVLFKCICGFMQLDSGSIRIDGQTVNPAVAQNIGANTLPKSAFFVDIQNILD